MKLSIVLKYVFLHLLLLGGAYTIYGLFAGHPLIPDGQHLLRFDSINYFDIKNNGYTYKDYDVSTVAFFPGFPYLWKFTGLGTLGISVLNALLFVIAFVFLCRFSAKDFKTVLLFLSLPSILFMYVPYSEALFFLPCTLLLYGLQKRNSALIMIALFLCSLCRSASNIFLPAVIIMEIIAADNPKKIRNIVLYSLSLLAGVFLVAWLQYIQTGQWFGFLTSQKFWEVRLRIPSLPFHTWGDMDYLDGAALLAGLLACGAVVYILMQFIRREKKHDNKAIIFSLLYVSGLTLFTVTFKGGSLFSLNRYIIPTAFFFVFLDFAFRRKLLSFKQIGIISLCIFAFWLLFHSYAHIRVLTGYFLFTIYLSLYLMLNHKEARISAAAFYILYLLNIVLQVHLFYRFLDNHWVG